MFTSNTTFIPIQFGTMPDSGKPKKPAAGFSTSSSASYKKAQFKKALKSHTRHSFKNDNSDLLVYLIYLNYLKKLVEGSQEVSETGEISVRSLDAVNEDLMRQFRG